MKQNSTMRISKVLLKIRQIGYSTIQVKAFSVLLLFLTMLFLATLSAEAATVYVRANATGANTGLDWDNAFTKLPDRLVRGAVYYIADGNYGWYNFDDPASGSLYIYIKKATVSDHGTNTGWSSSYGDGVATFSGWDFQTSYWDVDGQVGQWSDDLSNYVPYGFEVRNENTWNNQFLINIGTSSNWLNYITIKHANVYFTSTTSWMQYSDMIITYGDNITFQYGWYHRAASNNMTLRGSTVVDHCVIEESGTAEAFMHFGEHSINVRLVPFTKNVTFSNNIVRRWRVTGAFGLYGYNQNISIYGNVFYCDASGGTYQGSTGFCNTSNNGIINGMGYNPSLYQGIGYSNIYIYNNTFADLGTTASFTSIPEAQYWINVPIIKNNIFYNVPNLNTGYSKKSYNWYYNSGSQSETGIQIGTGNPFVNSSGKDYRLTSATNTGAILESQYSQDMLGNIRGLNGVWDRGAFVYISTNSGAKPSAPTILSIN